VDHPLFKAGNPRLVKLGQRDGNTSVIGFVAGIIWPADGGEWLAKKTGLVRGIGTGPETDPHVYTDPAKAARRAEKLLQQWGSVKEPFFRPYTLTIYKRADTAGQGVETTTA
jgi:hypothetical protein